MDIKTAVEGLIVHLELDFQREETYRVKDLARMYVRDDWAFYAKQYQMIQAEIYDFRWKFTLHDEGDRWAIKYQAPYNSGMDCYHCWVHKLTGWVSGARGKTQYNLQTHRREVYEACDYLGKYLYP